MRDRPPALASVLAFVVASPGCALFFGASEDHEHGHGTLASSALVDTPPGPESYGLAMAAYDYTKALDVAQAWNRRAPGELASVLAVAQASNSLADLTKDPGEAEVHIQRSLQLLSAGSAAASQPSDSGPMHYHWAEALGMRARLQGTGALVILPSVVEHAEAAVKQAPGADDGGPLRLLGILLVKAPAWPNGPGDSDRGVQLLQEAMQRFPARAEAYIHYADALLDMSRVADAQRQLALGRDRLGPNPRARKLYIEVEGRLKQNKKVKAYD